MTCFMRTDPETAENYWFLSGEVVCGGEEWPSPYLTQTGNAEWNVHIQHPCGKCGLNINNWEHIDRVTKIFYLTVLKQPSIHRVK